MTDDEPPAEHIRNALALMVVDGEPTIGPRGKEFRYRADTISAVHARLWRAVEQLENNGR
jgi:hypothetical protein